MNRLSLSTREETDAVKSEISKWLKEHEFVKSDLVFSEIVDHPRLMAKYRAAQQYSTKNFLNDHDKLHALNVTSLTLKTFEILKDEMSLRRPPFFGFYIEQSCRSHIKNPSYLLINDLICICLILSSYCHDMYKFLREHSSGAAYQISSIAEEVLPQIVRPKTIDVIEDIITTSQRCLQKHSGTTKADTAEEGLVMLGDVLDNDVGRIRRLEPKEVVVKDEKPHEYYGCKNILHPIRVKKGVDKKIDIIATLKNDAGWYIIKEIYKVVINSGFCNLISLFAIHPDYEAKIMVL